MIRHIHIIHGPNLNLLGKREPEIYGNTSFEEFFDELKNQFPELQLNLFQSNHEGLLIDKMQEVGFHEDTGIILNAAGLSHTSISLRDTVSAISVPVVEVHISNIFAREHFRWHSYMTAVCATHFIGMGLEGYHEAIRFLSSKP